MSVTNGSYATLDLAQLREKPPQVVITPVPALFAVAADLAGARRGVADDWLKAARAQLERVDLATLSPLGASGFMPGSLAPLEPDEIRDRDVQDEIERIATLPEETLLEDIDFAFGNDLTAPWQAIARNPRRWLLRYARCLSRIWRGMRPYWTGAAQFFDRELDRVDRAVAQSTVPELMSSLHYRGHVMDETWRIADPDPVELWVPDSGLLLMPMIGAPTSARAGYSDDGQLHALLYPPPGALAIRTRGHLPTGPALDALLGAQRATVLRVLDRPKYAGDVAAALLTSPGGASHHLANLEAAGLIVRERAGRHVVVHRSRRGTELLGLYEG